MAFFTCLTTWSAFSSGIRLILIHSWKYLLVKILSSHKILPSVCATDQFLQYSIYAMISHALIIQDIEGGVAINYLPQTADHPCVWIAIELVLHPFPFVILTCLSGTSRDEALHIDSCSATNFSHRLHSWVCFWLCLSWSKWDKSTIISWCWWRLDDAFIHFHWICSQRLLWRRQVVLGIGRKDAIFAGLISSFRRCKEATAESGTMSRVRRRSHRNLWSFVSNLWFARDLEPGRIGEYGSCSCRTRQLGGLDWHWCQSRA